MNYESLLDAMEGVAFVTTTDGTITAVGTRNWNAFASSNGAPKMNASSVLGCKLFDFVSGVDVRERLARLMAGAAVDPGASIVMPLRCDSPGTRRCLRQSIGPIFSEGICDGFVFQSIELYAKQRPSIDLFDFKKIERLHARDKSLPVVVMCSWCQRVRFPPIAAGDWIEAEEYYGAGGKSRIRLSHGICDRCSEMISIP